MLKNNTWLIPISLIFCATISRIIPHSPNFTPILSIALFAGATISQKRFAIIVPLLAMILSDAFIGFHSLSIPIYLIMMLVGFFGMQLKDNPNSKKIIGYSFLSSCIFFALSNCAVWIFSNLYSKDVSGFLECYFAAIPFFHNTLLSTVLYSCTMFGLLHVIQTRYRISVKA